MVKIFTAELEKEVMEGNVQYLVRHLDAEQRQKLVVQLLSENCKLKEKVRELEHKILFVGDEVL